MQDGSCFTRLYQQHELFIPLPQKCCVSAAEQSASEKDWICCISMLVRHYSPIACPSSISYCSMKLIFFHRFCQLRLARSLPVVDERLSGAFNMSVNDLVHHIGNVIAHVLVHVFYSCLMLFICSLTSQVLNNEWAT